MLQTLVRRGGSALLRRRRLPTTGGAIAPPALLPGSSSSSIPPPTVQGAAGAAGGARPHSTAAAAAAQPQAKQKSSPPRTASPQRGRDKPKKRKGKKPSATQAYLAERAAALASHEAAAKAAKLPWRTVAACIIERHPIIMRDPEPWEAEYFAMQEQLMQHGRAFPKDLNVMGSEEEYQRTDADVLKELPFKLAPRVTKADRLNDRTTLNRALAERLFLLVKGPATGGDWGVPQGEYKATDAKSTMRAYHEALIQAFMGEKFEAYVPSNAPIGFHWRALPAAEQQAQGVYGDKMFFYRSQHLKGRGRVVAEGVEEFVWVTREEAGGYLKAQDPEYVKLFTAIL